MYISITYAGVDEHIERIREELREIERLRDGLHALCRQSNSVDPASLWRALGELQRVQESAHWRMDFLSGLIVDLQRANAEASRLTEDIALRLNPPAGLTP